MRSAMRKMFTNTVAATSSTSSTPATSPATSENYGVCILNEPARRESIIVDIVFVHGLIGDRTSTWRDERSGIFWPRDLLANDISDARVMTFGYDADIVGLWSPTSHLRVSNHARNLLGGLARHRTNSYEIQRGIIFISHSLGGLVVEEALNLSRSDAEGHIRMISEHTVAIAFLGTPHHGSDMAAWGLLGGKLVRLVQRPNTEILAVLEPGSEMLASIQNRFHSSMRVNSVAITCFFEELEYGRLGLIVPMHSAILPAYPHYGIHANHSQMTKFGSRTEDGYDAILGELKRWISGLRPIDQPEETTAPPLPPLLAAASQPNLEAFEAVLRAAPDVDVTKPDSLHTALHIAAMYNQPVYISKLLQAGANPYAVTDKGCTPLFVGAIFGHEEVVKVFLEETPQDANEKHANGTTLLHAATINERVQVVRLLLERGAHPNARESSGWTPLDCALHKRNEELVRILSEAGSTRAAPLLEPPQGK